MRRAARAAYVLVLIAAPSAALYAVGFDLKPADGHATHVFPALYYPLFAGYLAAAWWVWRHPGSRGSLLVVLVAAVAFRLLAMGDAPALSSDVYRYPWDGQVQRAGLSPYAHPPGDPALAHLRDDAIHPHINRPGAITVYPPGAQILFRALPFDLDAVRLAFVGLDLLTLALLAMLLARLGLDPARVVLYAWSPLVVYEVAHSGHLEAAMLPLLVGAALAWHARRDLAAGLLLGLATAMKLYPVLAAVALGRRRPVWVLGAALAVVAALYAVYAQDAGVGVLGFLPRYVGVAEDYNIGLRALLELLVGVAVDQHVRELAFGLCLVALALGLVWIWRSDGPLELRLLHTAGLYLLTLPTAFHPWYALWLVPWLCVHPRAAWLWLTAALPLSYLQYGSPDGVMPAWVVPLELLPTAALLVLPHARAALGYRPSP